MLCGLFLISHTKVAQYSSYYYYYLKHAICIPHNTVDVNCRFYIVQLGFGSKWLTNAWSQLWHIVGSKSGVLWPLNCNHFLTPVLVSQDPIKKNERGYPSRFFWLFEILAILEVVTSSDTHVPLFRNILVRTWGCRISLDSEWWEEAENVYVDISRYWKSRYKCENASNERAR